METIITKKVSIVLSCNFSIALLNERENTTEGKRVVHALWI